MKKLREITLNEIGSPKRGRFNSFYYPKGPNSVPSKAYSASELTQKHEPEEQHDDEFSNLFKNNQYSVFHKPDIHAPWKHDSDHDSSITAARKSQDLKNSGSYDVAYGFTKTTDDYKENPTKYVKKIKGNLFKESTDKKTFVGNCKNSFDTKN